MYLLYFTALYQSVVVCHFLCKNMPVLKQAKAQGTPKSSNGFPKPFEPGMGQILLPFDLFTSL